LTAEIRRSEIRNLYQIDADSDVICRAETLHICVDPGDERGQAQSCGCREKRADPREPAAQQFESAAARPGLYLCISGGNLNQPLQQLLFRPPAVEP